MTAYVPPEIGSGYRDGGILVLGRDPGKDEVREGRPFVGAAGRLLDRCLASAGIRRKDIIVGNLIGRRPPGNDFGRHRPEDVERGLSELGDLLERARPNIVIALGNEANKGLLPDQWPGEDVFGARGILDRRGYLWWSDRFGVKVLSAVHPAALLHGGGSKTFGSNAIIGEMLLTWDLERARDHSKSADLGRPDRSVTVIQTPDQLNGARTKIRSSGLVASDIEIRDPQTLACIGFAPSESESFIFTENVFEEAFRILEDPSVPLLFQNGQFDLYFLKSREGVRVEGFREDSIIAWHIAMGELSGSEKTVSGKRKGKKTEKSLRFLCSLFCNIPYYKDYDFAGDHEMYRLNGYDCMATLEVLRKIKALFPEYGIGEEIYRHEIDLVWPVTTILERGIRIDEDLRVRRKDLLDERLRDVNENLLGKIRPILEDRRDRIEKPHLIWKTVTCGCCRNGSGKRERCWSCAGFEEKPSKKDLVERFGNPDGLVKDDLEAEVLGICEECDGVGQWEEFDFNPGSNDQVKDLIYNVLRLPKRYDSGTLSVNEDSLTSILSTL